ETAEMFAPAPARAWRTEPPARTKSLIRASPSISVFPYKPRLPLRRTRWSSQAYGRPRKTERYLKTNLASMQLEHDAFFVLQRRHLAAAYESDAGACSAIGACDILR